MTSFYINWNGALWLKKGKGKEEHEVKIGMETMSFCFKFWASKDGETTNSYVLLRLNSNSKWSL